MKLGFSLPHMGSIASADNITKAARFAETEGFEKLGINHINLSFDFSSHTNNLQKRLEYSKQIKDEIIPPVLA